jgi:hypothetical protein
MELEEDEPELEDSERECRSKEQAQEALNICVKSLSKAMERLCVPMPKYVCVSGSASPFKQKQC